MKISSKNPDLSGPDHSGPGKPSGSVGRWLARKFVRGYQLTFSALMGRNCRYLPSCSEYTDTAIARFGVWPGMWVGLARIARCRPGGANGYDPVPDCLAAGASWFTPWRYGDWRGQNIEISLKD